MDVLHCANERAMSFKLKDWARDTSVQQHLSTVGKECKRAYQLDYSAKWDARQTAMNANTLTQERWTVSWGNSYTQTLRYSTVWLVDKVMTEWLLPTSTVSRVSSGNLADDCQCPNDEMIEL